MTKERNDCCITTKERLFTRTMKPMQKSEVRVHKVVAG
jgi:hypothetical protein